MSNRGPSPKTFEKSQYKKASSLCNRDEAMLRVTTLLVEMKTIQPLKKYICVNRIFNSISFLQSLHQPLCLFLTAWKPSTYHSQIKYYILMILMILLNIPCLLFVCQLYFSFFIICNI